MLARSNAAPACLSWRSAALAALALLFDRPCWATGRLRLRYSGGPSGRPKAQSECRQAPATAGGGTQHDVDFVRSAPPVPYLFPEREVRVIRSPCKHSNYGMVNGATDASIASLYRIWSCRLQWFKMGRTGDKCHSIYILLCKIFARVRVFGKTFYLLTHGTRLAKITVKRAGNVSQMTLVPSRDRTARNS